MDNNGFIDFDEFINLIAHLETEEKWDDQGEINGQMFFMV